MWVIVYPTYDVEVKLRKMNKWACASFVPSNHQGFRLRHQEYHVFFCFRTAEKERVKVIPDQDRKKKMKSSCPVGQ